MTEERAAVLDEVIEDLRQMLAKCDRGSVGSVPAIYDDLAMNLFMRERYAGLVEAA